MLVLYSKGNNEWNEKIIKEEKKLCINYINKRNWNLECIKNLSNLVINK